jgi:DNA-binding response OmpR family regulator
VWGPTHDPMTNIVDVHIRALRAKIDQNSPRSLITTVRGVGYMLEAKE